MVLAEVSTMTTACAVYEGRKIVEVLDICPDGMVLCLTEDDLYEYVHEDEIEIEWRQE